MYIIIRPSFLTFEITKKYPKKKAGIYRVNLTLTGAGVRLNEQHSVSVTKETIFILDRPFISFHS